MIRLKPQTIKDLKKLILQKKTICFGTGIQGMRAPVYFQNWDLSDRLIAFCDNDLLKIGSEIAYADRKIPVIAPPGLLEYDPDKTLILITSLAYESIYDQLFRLLADYDYTVTSLDETADAELDSSSYNAVVKESDKQMIPKIIHYAWFGGDKPKAIADNIAGWKKICPDYHFIEWNNDNYDVHKNRYMKQAYERHAWGFVPDYMRLDALYQYGGIYLDTDIELIKKPDELLYQNCFASVDASLTMNLGSGFGCRAGEPIIKELRDYYDTVDFIREDGSIDKTSCNTHSLKVLTRYGVSINNRLQNVDGMNIYPMVFQGKNQYTGKIRVTDKTFWIHHGNMSWFRINRGGV